jgi:hypothetical protein
MSDGRHCPACKKDIGLWPVFLAVWPTRVKCPHCKSLLRYDINVWRTLFLFVIPLAVVFVVLPLVLMSYFFGGLDIIPLILALILYFVLWEAFEIINAVYWRSHKTLEIVKRGSDKTIEATPDG